MSYDFSNKRMPKNIMATVTQVLISGIVFFVLYRFLYDQLGVEQIGVWSLVLASTAVSKIGELGLSAGVVKFVAQALGRDDVTRASDVIQTIALTLGLVMAILLISCYPLFVFSLTYLLPQNGLPVALTILPYALISLWLMVFVSVFVGGLNGCMRMDIRSLIMVVFHLIYLGLAFYLVPSYGLEGVAIAQLIQSVGLMVVLWMALKKQISPLPLFPMRWKFRVLKEMFAYGVNFQIISIMNMLFDPMVKAMMSKFGGLEALGYYEMANKLILQGRSLIVEASRVMVPVIASIQEHDAQKSKQLFITSYKLTFYVSVLFYGMLGIFITAISSLWLGHYQETFIQFALLLNFGWFINTLIGPAYFSNLGSGNLKPNMVSHAIITASSLLVGAILGINYGAIGVVIGAVFAIMIGSLYLLIAYMKKININWEEFIIPNSMIKLITFSLFLVICSNFALDQSVSLMAVITISILCGIPLIALGWSNQERLILLRKS